MTPDDLLGGRPLPTAVFAAVLVRDAAEIDTEVAGWLAEAADRAG